MGQGEHRQLFYLNQNENCEICSNELRNQAKQTKQIDFHRDFLDKTFLCNGFILFSKDISRIYAKLSTVEGEVISEYTIHINKDNNWSLFDQIFQIFQNFLIN